MEDDHCVIKDKRPIDQLIEKVPMTSNCLFPLKIVPKNYKAAFKAEIKEEVIHSHKKENDNAEIQSTFQTEVHDDS